MSTKAAWSARLDAADGKLTENIGVRMTERMHGMIVALAKHHGMSKSMMIRTMVVASHDQILNRASWPDDNSRRAAKCFVEVKVSPVMMDRIEEQADFHSLSRAAVVRMAVHNYLGSLHEAQNPARSPLTSLPRVNGGSPGWKGP